MSAINFSALNYPWVTISFTLLRKVDDIRCFQATSLWPIY